MAPLFHHTSGPQDGDAIIIAHRLATIRDADRIAVIRGGRIVELGCHNDLIASGGHYQDLYETYQELAGERVPVNLPPTRPKLVLV